MYTTTIPIKMQASATTSPQHQDNISNFISQIFTFLFCKLDFLNYIIGVQKTKNEKTKNSDPRT